MNALRFALASLLPALLACSASGPEAAGGTAGSAGAGGSDASSSSSSTGGAASSSSSSGGGDAGACAYGATYCSGNFCTCQLSPPSPNCVTANGNGTPADGCDDGNPCTQDVPDPKAPGGCAHLFAGLGSACSADHAMQCVVGGTGEQCCPTDPHPICSAEGVQAECAAGSVCLEGMCWIACSTQKDCAGSEVGPNCVVLAVGHVSAKVCGF